MNHRLPSLFHTSTRLPWVFPGLAACVLVLTGAVGCGKEEKTAGLPPPPSVEVVEVVQKDVPVHAEWVGTLDGLVNATIRA